MDLFNEAGVLVTTILYNDGISTLKLTNTGTYTLLVRDRGNNNTGTYFLSLVYATPKCSATLLSCDIAATNTMTTPAQQHIYTIYGYAGERIRLTSVGISGGVCPDIDVFNESGTRVGGFDCNDFASRLTLPVSAAYTVVVRDRGNNNTGSYTLSLDAVGGCARLSIVSTITRTQEV